MKSILKKGLPIALVVCALVQGKKASAIIATTHPLTAVTYMNVALGAILIVDADLKDIANVQMGTRNCFTLCQGMMGWIFLKEEKRPEFSFSELSEEDGALLEIDDVKRGAYNENLPELNRIFENVLLFAEEQESDSPEVYMDAWHEYMDEIDRLGVDFRVLAKILRHRAHAK